MELSGDTIETIEASTAVQSSRASNIAKSRCPQSERTLGRAYLPPTVWHQLGKFVNLVVYLDLARSNLDRHVKKG